MKLLKKVRAGFGKLRLAPKPVVPSSNPTSRDVPGSAAAVADPGVHAHVELFNQHPSDAQVRQQPAACTDAGLDAAELAHYRQLEQSIAELQGLQIPAQTAQARRRASALQQQLATAQEAVEERRREVTDAQAQLAKFASGAWYPGKGLLGKKRHKGKLATSRERLEEANQQLSRQKEAVANLEGQLQEVHRRLAAWQLKETELAAAQQAAEELEARVFPGAGRAQLPCRSSPGGEAEEEQEEEDLALVDTLCLLEEGEEGTGSEAGEGSASASHDDQASAQAEGQPIELYGAGYFRGRLVRLAAHKLKQALSSRRRRRREVLQGVAASIGAKGPLKPSTYQKDFPLAANTFNPLLHCPPSTFLWPYSHKFMGKLQRLQTGPVLQAFYRFGPFDFDPEDPSRRAGAGDAGAGGSGPRPPPLILLPGLGATMIAWGVPLLRALACSHEVIVMEYRGAGLSVDSSGQPWTYYGQAEAVLMLAEALGISRPDILGWSSGGNVGLVLATLHGGRVGRVASLAGMAGGRNTIVPPMYEMLNPERSLSLGQTMALLFPPEDPDFRKVVAQYLKAVASMPGAMTNSSVGAKAAQEQWEADHEFIHNDERVWEGLPGISTPVLILSGEQDILVPVENAHRLAARIPGAQLHTFAGWGHAYKSPAQLAEVVTAFLLQPGPEAQAQQQQAQAPSQEAQAQNQQAQVPQQE